MKELAQRSIVFFFFIVWYYTRFVVEGHHHALFFHYFYHYQKYVVTATATSSSSFLFCGVRRDPTTTTTTTTTTSTPTPKFNTYQQTSNIQMFMSTSITSNNDNVEEDGGRTNTNTNDRRLYNIPYSGWTSPQWNWGRPYGTGHDCAYICRSKYSTKEARRKLVHALLDDYYPVEYCQAQQQQQQHPPSHHQSNNNDNNNDDDNDDNGDENEDEVSFEEIKLILALAWQRGRWDNTDGGSQGYRIILQTMIDARRYENEDEIVSALHFIEDVSSKFHSISRNVEEEYKMKDVVKDIITVHNGKMKKEETHPRKEEIFMTRRICAGMILDAMNFVETGL